MSMTISPAGITTLMGREGVRLTAYRDSVGVWTIGVGHTAAAGPPTPSAGMEISRDTAMAIYTRDLRPYVAAVNSAVRVACSQAQFDAMVSLCFNIGPGGFTGSRVVRRLNAGAVTGAADAFVMWVHPPELRGRRIAERGQFLSDLTPVVTTRHAPPPVVVAKASAVVVASGAAAAAASGGHVPTIVGVAILAAALAIVGAFVWRSRAAAPVVAPPAPLTPPAPAASAASPSPSEPSPKEPVK